MKIYHITKVLLVCLVISLTACNEAGDVAERQKTPIGQVSTSSRPNIILIMADDMGLGDTGYAGNYLALTPNLDAMASSGTVFERFYSAAPVCSPTRGSVMTGRHPYRYGIFFANVGHMPHEELTLAELLKDVGYQTGFFGKWHLGTLTTVELDANRGGRPEQAHEYSPPWEHGFDRVFATESKTPTYDPMIKPKAGYQQTWWNPVTDSDNAEFFGTYFWDETGAKVEENLEGDDTAVIMDRAIAFIEEAAASGTPFLTVVWPHAPHLPVVASDQDRAAIATDDPYTGHYYGSIKALDSQIGRVRKTLENAGVADNTLIWFTSDNGPEHHYPSAPGNNGGLRGTKRSLYEGGIRVPGIIEWPDRIKAGTRISAPGVTSDILPTILDYLGITYPDPRPLDGISLRALLEEKTRKRGQPIAFESANQLVYMDDRYKIVYQPSADSSPGTPDLQGRSISGNGKSGQNPNFSLKYELYDLLEDPVESRSISNNYPVIVERMKQELDIWRKSVSESLKKHDYNHRDHVITRKK